MSQLRFGFVCLGGWLVWLFWGLVFCYLFRWFWSYFLFRLFEFIYGDLCLSAHIAPLPVQKKYRRAATLIVPKRSHRSCAFLGAPCTHGQ